MAGYSTTPLVKKLGIRPAMTVLFLHAPKNFASLLIGLPKIQRAKNLQGTIDYVHVFVTRGLELKKLFPKIQKSLKKDGFVWVSWPKQSSKITSDINENDVRALGLDAGLVDVKVAAIDNDWSGLKFVFRLRDR